MEKTLVTNNIQSKVNIDTSVWIKFTYGEAKVLQDIAGYGTERFLEWFKKNLGKHYIEQHEQHLKSAFEKMYQETKFHTYKVEQIDKLIAEYNKPVEVPKPAPSVKARVKYILEKVFTKSKVEVKK